MTALTFRQKKQQSRVFFMFPLTWITEKQLERVIENKRDEFCRAKNMKIQSSRETMRNGSRQQGENERQKNKSEHEHRRQNWVSTYNNSTIK